jgi:putative FmdB family regulatory protein
MAIYDLKCNDCGHQFEKFVTGFLTEDDKECPKCKSQNVSQVLSSSFGIGSSYSSSSCGTPYTGGFG